MSDTQTTSKTPNHYAYHVRDREGKKGFFTKIGAAWAHNDGKGFNVQLEIMPLDGKLSLRTVEEKKD
jgi:hypothetical protein